MNELIERRRISCLFLKIMKAKQGMFIVNEMKRKERTRNRQVFLLRQCTWHNNVKDEYDCASITH